MEWSLLPGRWPGLRWFAPLGLRPKSPFSWGSRRYCHCLGAQGDTAIVLGLKAQAKMAAALPAPTGRDTKAQGNAPNALTQAFRLRAVLGPEAPKGRSTAALANGLGFKKHVPPFPAKP